jgi:hypothetical protein
MRYRRAAPWGLAFIIAEGRIANRKIQAMAGQVLQTLLAVRREHERRAERALATALPARARAEAEATRLTAAVAAARATLATRRQQDVHVDVGGDARAGDALGRQRFYARLAGDVEARLVTARAFEAQTLAPARAAEDTARADHLRARQRREVVERAIERRVAAARREADRREEAAADDNPRLGAKRGS